MLAPDLDAEPLRIFLHPLPVAATKAGIDREPEPGDFLTGGGDLKFWVGPDVAGDGDPIDVVHRRLRKCQGHTRCVADGPGACRAGLHLVPRAPSLGIGGRLPSSWAYTSKARRKRSWRATTSCAGRMRWVVTVSSTASRTRRS